MKNQKVLIIAVVSVVVIIFGLTTFKTELFKGAFKPLPVATASPTCGATFQKIFEGNADNSGSINVAVPLTETQLTGYLINGCSFKVVKDYTNGSTRFINSFDCGNVSWQNATNAFNCTSTPATGDGYSQSSFMNLDFIGATASSYRGAENDFAGETIKISIFAKK